MSKLIVLINLHFGRLVVKERAENSKDNKARWLCMCSCGKETTVTGKDLRNGHVQSCGCLQKELLSKRVTKHSKSGTPIYKTWYGMIKRCVDKNHKAYHYYGGRGISVCERWMKFENFFEDMGERPKGKTLDRWPDKNGNYEPSNCRWATSKEQAANKQNRKDQRNFRAFHKETGNIYEDNNQCNFAKCHGLNPGHVGSCLHGKRKSHKGWIFEYLPME